VSKVNPKAGEAYAIRRPGAPRIPEDIQDDDTYVGMSAVSRGTHAVYAPGAIIYNRVPTTVGDFLKQRWRINRQQVGLHRTSGIGSDTWRPRTMSRAIARFIRSHPDSLLSLGLLGALEGAVRCGAIVASLLREEPLVLWNPVASTKGAIIPPSPR
jgi:hypothetical protein